jgi:hypothetical protein
MFIEYHLERRHHLVNMNLPPSTLRRDADIKVKASNVPTFYFFEFASLIEV